MSVSKAEFTKIKDDLKEKLEKYKSIFLGSDLELTKATEHDLVPTNLRKQLTISEQVYSYMEARGSINLFEAERLFLITRKPLNSLMKGLQDKGYPVAAHWVSVQDQVVPGKEIDMIDYYYIAG